MSAHLTFEFGDRVRHTKRPEWGIGSVVKVEPVTHNGSVIQRVSVRFPNAGVKTLMTSHAELEPVAETAADNGQADIHASPMDFWRALEHNNWLEPVAKRRMEEFMTTLPAEARDAFNSLRSRLSFTLELYRFDRHGGRLLDWAVAQSGLDDPLTRFTRHDLEVLFDRWSQERDAHLARLILEARLEPALVKQLAAAAPPGAREAVRRINARALT